MIWMKTWFSPQGYKLMGVATFRVFTEPNKVNTKPTPPIMAAILNIADYKNMSNSTYHALTIRRFVCRKLS